MTATVAPYSPAETRQAAYWLEYISAAYAMHGADTVAEADASARRAISLLERTGQVTAGAATLLLQIFDLSPLDMA